MPQNVHHYSLRRLWQRDEDFVESVVFLRSYGYTAIFQKTRYTQINVCEKFYWTMGWPLDGTILINRKVLPEAENVIEDENQKSSTDDYEVFERIGSLANRDILEVNCGAGRTLDMVGHQLDLGRYLGIDASERKLARLRRRYPSEIATIRSELYDFVAPEPGTMVERDLWGQEKIPPVLYTEGCYDVVLVLYGAGSSLSDEELRRIPLLLRPGGRAVLTFFREPYEPKLDDRAGARPLMTPWRGQFPGIPHVIGNYVLVIYEK